LLNGVAAILFKFLFDYIIPRSGQIRFINKQDKNRGNDRSRRTSKLAETRTSSFQRWEPLCRREWQRGWKSSEKCGARRPFPA